MVEAKSANTIVVNAPVEISHRRIGYLLCSAFEGGSNYWYEIQEFIKPPGFHFQLDKDQVFRHIDYPLNEGGALVIGIKDDFEDETDETWRLDTASLTKGLVTMAQKYPRHWGDFIQENDDAETADVFLQCCLFGEIVYG
jgi:hypothetical protein